MGSPKYGISESYDNRIWKGRVESKYKELSDIERGYIAGFLDGEGCISFCQTEKAGRYSIYWQISFYNTNINPLLYIQKCIGGRIKEREKKDGLKNCFTLFLRKQETLNFLPQIIGHLQVKKEQAEAVLKFLACPHSFTEESKKIYRENRLRNMNCRTQRDYPINTGG